jgi:hypothetical protein
LDDSERKEHGEAKASPENRSSGNFNQITGKKVQIKITLPENVRKRLFHQLKKFEKD